MESLGALWQFRRSSILQSFCERVEYRSEVARLEGIMTWLSPLMKNRRDQPFVAQVNVGCPDDEVIRLRVGDFCPLAARSLEITWHFSPADEASGLAFAFHEESDVWSYGALVILFERFPEAGFGPARHFIVGNIAGESSK